jgi:hypothetical protein
MHFPNFLATCGMLAVTTDMLLVKVLEVAIGLLVKTHQNRHDLTEA